MQARGTFYARECETPAFSNAHCQLNDQAIGVMKSSKCAFSTAAALHRVFIAPIEIFRPGQSQFTQRTISSTSASTLRFTSRAPRYLLAHQQKCYASSAAAKSRLPRDDEIKSWSVTLVGEDGKLQDPRPTLDILDSIDRKKESLIVVVPGEPGTPPICRIMNKEAMRVAEKAKAKAARGSITEKTIELNWAIDGNDLNHRLMKMKGFLQKGFRVDVVLGAKRKGRKATEEEAEALIEKVKKAAGEVEGTRESKPKDGKLLGMLTLQFEGKLKR
jgi:translation initiation factor IF-3